MSKMYETEILVYLKIKITPTSRSLKLNVKTHETTNLKNRSCPPCEEIETTGLSYFLTGLSLT